MFQVLLETKLVARVGRLKLERGPRNIASLVIDSKRSRTYVVDGNEKCSAEKSREE